MREKSAGGEEPRAKEGEQRKKRVDLSLPQVAGSAVAAVVAAKLASYFGVYGTILGAGVVSAIATCGGTVFQHFFKRTGEQLRDVTVQTKPRPQQTPVTGQFTEGTVYRARVRSWKRPVVAAALVFGVTMAGITTYELVSGQSFSGDGTSTTVGDAFKSGGSSSNSKPGTTPSSGSSSGEPSATDSTPGTESGSGADAPQGDGGVTTPAPTPSSSAASQAPADTPAPTDGSSTSPAPDASSRSRSADPGQAGPSVP
ncbi:hypothetical protein ACFV8Z_28195 [Streptomyces sp. NPDC059837]|uniref:hypothetical protein n=1 Tax=unclassified Streptomyces TaxID=2593676 RepID=UPI00224D4740|nr:MULTISPECIES: hypothetical protein [unclassified Streptomyces]MCX4407412.1 hypothetical protein [Streptomyces sp. NBC_01764]MCX5187873.1 hypothetical protein [Streptomyces sp. NBC_00268]